MAAVLSLSKFTLAGENSRSTSSLGQVTLGTFGRVFFLTFLFPPQRGSLFSFVSFMFVIQTLLQVNGHMGVCGLTTSWKPERQNWQTPVEHLKAVSTRMPDQVGLNLELGVPSLCLATPALKCVSG